MKDNKNSAKKKKSSIWRGDQNEIVANALTPIVCSHDPLAA